MKAYTVENFKKVDNQEVDYDFPVMYPNTTYFDSLQKVLNSYGHILNNLAAKNYNILEFIEDMESNPHLSSFAKDCDFTIEKKGSKDHLFNCETLFNRGDDKYTVMELYYTDEKIFIEDKENGMYEVSMYADLGNLQVYFTGGYLYVKGDNISKFIYLD